eukprot:m.135151 g.135151  ORF g.135151 m.135151 type:complete len:55 (+) comp38157_c0_seq34:2136-2300(+)
MLSQKCELCRDSDAYQAFAYLLTFVGFEVAAFVFNFYIFSYFLFLLANAKCFLC